MNSYRFRIDLETCCSNDRAQCGLHRTLGRLDKGKTGATQIPLRSKLHHRVAQFFAQIPLDENAA